MDINELRIGNVVQDKTGAFFRVDGIVDGWVRTTADGMSWYTLNYFEGIILDNKMLEKLGFEIDDTGVDMFDQDYHEWYQKKIPVIGSLVQSYDKKYIFDEENDMLRITYLHEYQNLYFILTGCELEINF